MSNKKHATSLFAAGLTIAGLTGAIALAGAGIASLNQTAAAISSSGLSGTGSSSSTTTTTETTTETTTTIPTTSADTTTTTTTENPNTADSMTWLYAMASLVITGPALAGRHSFPKR